MKKSIINTGRSMDNFQKFSDNRDVITILLLFKCWKKFKSNQLKLSVDKLLTAISHNGTLTAENTEGLQHDLKLCAKTIHSIDKELDDFSKYLLFMDYMLEKRVDKSSDLSFLKSFCKG